MPPRSPRSTRPAGASSRSSAARPGSARRRSSTPSARRSGRGGFCAPRASRCTRRARSARSSRSPTASAASWRASQPQGRSRTRSRPSWSASSRRGPAVVVLEDIHWADEATLDVLRLLTRRLESVPALVDRDVPRRRAHAQPSAPRSARRVRRPRAPRHRRSAVAGSGRRSRRESGVDADALYRQTSGNPFFVTEALAVGGEGVPETVRDAVLARAARLGAERPPLARRRRGRAAEHRASAARPARAGRGRSARRVHDRAACCAPTQAASAFATSLRGSRSRTRFRRAHGGPFIVRCSRCSSTPADVDPARLAHHAEEAADTEAILRFAPEAAAAGCGGGLTS